MKAAVAAAFLVLSGSMALATATDRPSTEVPSGSQERDASDAAAGQAAEEDANGDDESFVGINLSTLYISDSKAQTPEQATCLITRATGCTHVKVFGYSNAHPVNPDGSETDVELQLDWLAANDAKISVAVPNEEMVYLADGENGESYADSIIEALEVNDRIKHVEYIFVGNEPMGSWQPKPWQYQNSVGPAVKNLHKRLKHRGHSSTTRVTVPFNAAILQSSYPPSAGAFNETIWHDIEPIAEILEETGAPFVINIYPYITAYQNQGISTEYAIFAKNPNDCSTYDNGLCYWNLFDAQYDSVRHALDKKGYSSVEIAIGEVGWPSAGDSQGLAGIYNAKTFVNNMIEHATSGDGTPYAPGIKIKMWLFELYDEDQKGTGAGQFEVHWGIFAMGATAAVTPKIKYDVDLFDASDTHNCTTYEAGSGGGGDGSSAFSLDWSTLAIVIGPLLAVVVAAAVLMRRRRSTEQDLMWTRGAKHVDAEDVAYTRLDVGGELKGWT